MITGYDEIRVRRDRRRDHLITIGIGKNDGRNGVRSHQLDGIATIRKHLMGCAIEPGKSNRECRSRENLAQFR
jgi:hypothetical protein